MINDIQGHVHSIETCGTVDGPGIRFVVFMQGCPLRCIYCHNPDTWKTGEGRIMTVDELMQEAGRYRSYMKASGGGVTVSGGEPLMQLEFLEAFFQRCHQQGIHTAVDTSGIVPVEAAEVVYNHTDLVLLDFKAYHPENFERITSQPIGNLFRTFYYLDKKQIPVWIRFVVIPGVTDNMAEIEEMAKFLEQLGNIERVDVNPFHKMGEYKWKQLGMEYELFDTEPPSPSVMEEARGIFRSRGLTVD